MKFLLGAGLLLLLVVALLVWALLRKPRDSRDENLADRLEDELADDVAAGVLTQEDLPAATSDIEVQDHKELRRSSRGGPWVWGLVGLVVVVGVVLYWQTGNWRAAIHGDRAAVLHNVNDVLAQLEAHLHTHPDDKRGWITLGRAKSELGDYFAAAQAYGQAVKLDREQSPELLARWGEAQILHDPKHLTQQEHAIFSAVLKAEPNSIRGLWYGGMLALNAGKRDLTITRWQRLLKQDIPAQMSVYVSSRLHALGAPATTGQPFAASGAASAPTITLTVKLAPGLAKKIEPGETLFVYVRNPDGGPPLAAKRVEVKRFPLQITLDNGDTMLAGHGLASMAGKTVEVGAFLSATGKATPQPGDPAATSGLDLGGNNQALTLTLDRPAN